MSQNSTSWGTLSKSVKLCTRCNVGISNYYPSPSKPEVWAHLVHQSCDPPSSPGSCCGGRCPAGAGSREEMFQWEERAGAEAPWTALLWCSQCETPHLHRPPPPPSWAPGWRWCCSLSRTILSSLREITWGTEKLSSLEFALNFTLVDFLAVRRSLELTKKFVRGMTQVTALRAMRRQWQSWWPGHVMSPCPPSHQQSRSYCSARFKGENKCIHIPNTCTTNTCSTYIFSGKTSEWKWFSLYLEFSWSISLGLKRCKIPDIQLV